MRDDGIFTVDSAPGGADWSGLAVSGGNNRGANSDGGVSVLDISDSGTFIVQQDLLLGLGTGATTDATLKVTGPNATVQVNGSLFLGTDANLNPGGIGRIEAVITGKGHSTIAVGESAELDLGDLVVGFDGYSPRGGESYTLLTADAIQGDFASTSLPELPDGLSWMTTVSDTSYTLAIDGSLGPLADLNADGSVDAADAAIMFAVWGTNGGDSGADLTGDGLVDAADAGELFSAWTGDGVAGASTVPEPTATSLAALGLLGLLARRRR